MKDWKKLVISIFICQMAGVVGSFFTAPAIKKWYVFLQKPTFAPPNWVFAPVWTTLYLLMGISLYLVWKKGLDKKEIKNSFNLFLIQLFFNSLWSVIFFGFRSILGGLIEIFVLLVLIVVIIKKFYKIEKLSSYLLIPYLLWGMFATFLNYQIVRLNL